MQPNPSIDFSGILDSMLHFACDIPYVTFLVRVTPDNFPVASALLFQKKT